MLPGLLCHIGGPRYVLIGGIGATAHQGGGDRIGVAFLLDGGGKLGYGARQVGRMRPHHVRLQFGEIDLHYLLVVLLRLQRRFRVRHQQLTVLVGHLRQPVAPRGLEVGFHANVIGEDGAGGAQFRAHVADCALARGAEAFHAGAKVFDDTVGAAGHCEQAAEVEDHVLGGGPAAGLPGELDADDLGVQHLPGKVSHHVHGLSAADAGSHHAQAACVGGMRVRADHQAAGEGVVFQYDLVNNAGARLPEANAVAARHGL